MNGFARFVLGIAASGVIGAGFAPSAEADSLDALTHLAMLKETAREAISEMLAGVPLTANESIVLRPGRAHAANWILSDLIAAELAASGYKVSVEEAPVSVPAGPTTAAAPAPATIDTTASLLDQLQAMQAAEQAAREAATAAVQAATAHTPTMEREADRRLEFRVGEFGVHYVGEGRPFFLGPKRVERATSVDVSCRLLEAGSEDVLWVGDGDAVRLDRISKSKLALFESPGFTPTPLPSRGGFRYVEPVVVGGIVAGLVYLFYTNQN